MNVGVDKWLLVYEEDNGRMVFKTDVYEKFRQTLHELSVPFDEISDLTVKDDTIGSLIELSLHDSGSSSGTGQMYVGVIVQEFLLKVPGVINKIREAANGVVIISASQSPSLSQEELENIAVFGRCSINPTAREIFKSIYPAYLKCPRRTIETSEWQSMLGLFADHSEKTHCHRNTSASFHRSLNHIRKWKILLERFEYVICDRVDSSAGVAGLVNSKRRLNALHEKIFRQEYFVATDSKPSMRVRRDEVNEQV
jgi:hypothetical protein